MDAILQQGIEFIVVLQQYGNPTLDAFFTVVTNLGGEYYLYLIPLVVWCIDFRLGTRLLLLFIFTLFINSVLKDLIAQPRPFLLDERVISPGEKGYGLPSGHAQLAVVFWGALAAWVRKPIFLLFAVTMIVLIGFSRVYLGVHFPSDVAAGWVLGALTLWLYLRYGDRFANWLGQLEPVRKLLLVFGISLLMVSPGSGSFESVLTVALGGFFLGTALAVMRGSSRLEFTGGGPGWQRLLRFALGMVVTLLLIYLMREYSAKPVDAMGLMVLYCEMAVLGIWLCYIAPRLFGRLALASDDTLVATGTSEP